MPKQAPGRQTCFRRFVQVSTFVGLEKAGGAWNITGPARPLGVKGLFDALFPKAKEKAPKREKSNCGLRLPHAEFSSRSALAVREARGC